MILIFGISIIFSYLLLTSISKKLAPIILNYATVEAKRFTIALMNSAIDKDIIEKISSDLFVITKDETGEIKTIDFNSYNVNILLNDISTDIEEELLLLEEGKINDINVSNSLKGYNFDKLKQGIVCEIPIGVIFNNVIFANTGPTIPIKLSFIGNVITNLKRDIRSYGINSAYIELSVEIEVNERITMPIMTKEQKVIVEIPLAVKIINGKVPNYYQGNKSNSESLSLPINR